MNEWKYDFSGSSSPSFNAPIPSWMRTNNHPGRFCQYSRDRCSWISFIEMNSYDPYYPTNEIKVESYTPDYRIPSTISNNSS